MDGFVEFTDRIEGVHLSQFAPMTTLLVWTWNSLYRLVVMDTSTVYVQGGECFRDPTSARLEGAGRRNGPLLTGRICLGLAMELRAHGTRITTSPVLAIATEPADHIVVH